MHTGNGVVERSIQTLKNLIITDLEDGKNLTESVTGDAFYKTYGIKKYAV